MAVTLDHPLAIYLIDHLAARTARGELVRRAARSNAGSLCVEVVERLQLEVEEDRWTLRRPRRQRAEVAAASPVAVESAFAGARL